ncbi:MAG TPA: Stp1/IreP family PP2C-type Ser/Thr phosphatase [Egibacteraceae bacterium]|mgnify:CR=1 FL=1
MTALRVAVAGRSDVGRLRDGNEDAWFIGRRVMVVADGLGGHAAGEVASRLAVEQLAALDERADASWADDVDSARAALREAIEAANRTVRQAAAADLARAGMGTTVTAAVVVGDRLCLGHVGDSRAYLLRDGALRQLTEDHSHVAELVRAGQITPAEARVHPHRAVITRALGLEDTVEVDTPEPEPLAPGDVVLLCSDGLTEPLTDEAIAQLIAGVDDPDRACAVLVDAANAAGGPDNITVVVAVVDGPA